MAEELTIEAQVEVARGFVAGLVEAMGYDGAEITATAEDDQITVDVRGGDLGLLIGPGGQTLSAIQELARTVLARRAIDGARLHVDVAGYREKRRVALERFTRDIAQRVLDSGEAVSLEPMHPADRKVVHDTVNDIEGLTTTSEGEEPRRRVVIRPAAG